MYNPVISKLALQAIRNLHPEVVLQVQRKTLFSQAEIDLLSTIKSSAVNLLLLKIFLRCFDTLKYPPITGCANPKWLF